MSTQIQFHNATTETFDLMPGEVTAYDADDRGIAFRVKNITLRATDGNLLRLSLYCDTPPAAPEPAHKRDESAYPLTPSLKAAIQRRLDERAAERAAAAAEQAKKDAERHSREERGKTFFIAELEQREGVILRASQVVVEEEINRTVYNISVPLSETITILFHGNMYYNKEKEFAFSSWDNGSGNWYFDGNYYPTLADAVIATLKTDIDLDTLFD